MTDFEYPPGTVRVLADRINKVANSQDYVDWAVDGLVSGFDSEALRVLSGLDWPGPVSRSEAEYYLGLACKELRLTIPDDETVLREYLRQVVEQIHEGTIESLAGVETIHRMVVSPLDHPEDLMPWCYLWEGNAPDCSRNLPEGDLVAAIRGFAADWIRG